MAVDGVRRFNLNPYALLILAALCFWVGSYYRAPLPLHHKVIVATGKMDDRIFAGTKIFIVRHDRSGAFGLIINKQGYGGPMKPEKVFTLHAPDVEITGSKTLSGVPVAYGEGDLMIVAKTMPQWSKVLHGYAGWKPRQLDNEVRRGLWDVREFTPSLME